MDLGRARSQDWLLGGLGALLVAALFLDWYRPCSVGDCASAPAVSAWEAFAVIDVIVALAGLGAIVSLVLVVTQRTPAVPVAVTSLVCLLAIVAALLAVFRLAVTPELPGSDVGASAARLLGAWLGAGASVGLLVALLAAIRDERTPVPARSLAEQRAAVRPLTLSSSRPGGERAPARGAGRSR